MECWLDFKHLDLLLNWTHVPTVNGGVLRLDFSFFKPKNINICASDIALKWGSYPLAAVPPQAAGGAVFVLVTAANTKTTGICPQHEASESLRDPQTSLR